MSSIDRVITCSFCNKHQNYAKKMIFESENFW
ncbi:MAG: hypothetical protein IT280_13455 [Ignavibacteria bacterium]|nr:hypothetical protein [Ignavibacteria bacterium]